MVTRRTAGRAEKPGPDETTCERKRKMEKKEQILRMIEKNKKRILEINSTIWDYAEPGMKEFRSADYYTRVFREEGFEVETGVSGIPTAFIASWGGGLPIIGFLGEFDALPGLSQESGCTVHRELSPGAYGQGCGHNSLGAGAAGAALAFRDYLKENGMSGTVRFYGCPGEEYGSGKVFMARDGRFDDLDACYTWHPDDINAVVGSSCLACLGVYFTFTGKTAHAAGCPHLGRSALDATELMSVGCNYLREHIIPEARLHYAYHDAGGIAPNVVQDKATVNYFIRAPKVKDMMEIYERVCDVARGAALMTGTKVEIRIYEGLSDYVPNQTLDHYTQQAFEMLGAPAYDAEDERLAREIRATLSDADKADVFTKLHNMGLSRGELSPDDILCRRVLPYSFTEQAVGGSTDVGDASYCAPTSQINVATMALGTACHSWQVTALGKTGVAEKGTLTAAAVMALGAALVADRPEVLKEAREEYVRTTGGKYQCPIPQGLAPNLD